MDWPSMSPDLNPIEHLWGILKQKVEERKVSNIHQLRDVIMEVWKRTPVATCEALVISGEYNFCVLLYTQSALHSCVCGGGGGSLLNHHQYAASTWMMRRLPQDNGASALTTHQLQVERRER